MYILLGHVVGRAHFWHLLVTSYLPTCRDVALDLQLASWICSRFWARTWALSSSALPAWLPVSGVTGQLIIILRLTIFHLPEKQEDWEKKQAEREEKRERMWVLLCHLMKERAGTVCLLKCAFNNGSILKTSVFCAFGQRKSHSNLVIYFTMTAGQKLLRTQWLLPLFSLHFLYLSFPQQLAEANKDNLWDTHWKATGKSTCQQWWACFTKCTTCVWKYFLFTPLCAHTHKHTRTRITYTSCRTSWVGTRPVDLPVMAQPCHTCLNHKRPRRQMILRGGAPEGAGVE